MTILLKKHKNEQYFGFFIAFMYIFGSLCLKMIAPRALLVLGNTDYEWLAEHSNYESSKAAREVWNTFGIADRMGYSIEGGHPHCQLPLSQYPEVEAFVDKFLLGKKDIDTNVTKAGQIPTP